MWLFGETGQRDEYGFITHIKVKTGLLTLKWAKGPALCPWTCSPCPEVVTGTAV